MHLASDEDGEDETIDRLNHFEEKGEDLSKEERTMDIDWEVVLTTSDHQRWIEENSDGSKVWWKERNVSRDWPTLLMGCVFLVSLFNRHPMELMLSINPKRKRSNNVRGICSFTDVSSHWSSNDIVLSDRSIDSSSSSEHQCNSKRAGRNAKEIFWSISLLVKGHSSSLFVSFVQFIVMINVPSPLNPLLWQCPIIDFISPRSLPNSSSFAQKEVRSLSSRDNRRRWQFERRISSSSSGEPCPNPSSIDRWSTEIRWIEQSLIKMHFSHWTTMIRWSAH